VELEAGVPSLDGFGLLLALYIYLVQSLFQWKTDLPYLDGLLYTAISEILDPKKTPEKNLFQLAAILPKGDPAKSFYASVNKHNESIHRHLIGCIREMKDIFQGKTRTNTTFNEAVLIAAKVVQIHNSPTDKYLRCTRETERVWISKSYKSVSREYVRRQLTEHDCVTQLLQFDAFFQVFFFAFCSIPFIL
jgi:hypothetical protein